MPPQGLRECIFLWQVLWNIAILPPCKKHMFVNPKIRRGFSAKVTNSCLKTKHESACFGALVLWFKAGIRNFCREYVSQTQISENSAKVTHSCLKTKHLGLGSGPRTLWCYVLRQEFHTFVENLHLKLIFFRNQVVVEGRQTLWCYVLRMSRFRWVDSDESIQMGRFRWVD